MRKLNRRAARQLAAAAGLTTVDEPAPAIETDRDFVIAAGMTTDEAGCWELIAKAAGKVFKLTKRRPKDAQEVASAIHLVQDKLLARPTYRKYLEIAKRQK